MKAIISNLQSELNTLVENYKNLQSSIEENETNLRNMFRNIDGLSEEELEERGTKYDALHKKTWEMKDKLSSMKIAIDGLDQAITHCKRANGEQVDLFSHNYSL